ncbi:Cysteine-rich small domain-containing protein [Clostridium collagenovorans DSM 3089]|uniref:Cysteine-rich small domain-containing protein n=1 Tax=Clostridium collagenovorans DSM 3089 TaxID=1121306 RepID=A0A1M5WKB3_9CLOT|nr:cysteine-rich small domain-containing protein [Clostridium collagenovorans]SHH87887.1 Cysteine-rich small domain-containing protein [Clostridium collagenovorans DSM 3089]
MGPNYKFSQHKKCEFFPCHKVANEDKFNCLFCYCPLYTLGSKCGGNFVYNEANIKDCSNCLIPHSENGYEYIMSKWELISELATKNK